MPFHTVLRQSPLFGSALGTQTAKLVQPPYVSSFRRLHEGKGHAVTICCPTLGILRQQGVCALLKSCTIRKEMGHKYLKH